MSDSVERAASADLSTLSATVTAWLALAPVFDPQSLDDFLGEVAQAQGT
jgi:hypothetical protein